MSTSEQRDTILVSLIIPTYNREELLVNTLRCALRQDRDDYEIVVVDQTPEHDTATRDFLHDNAGRINLVSLSKASVTAARNAGMRAARGKIFVFIDDDTSFEPDFLSRHLDAYADGIGAVQGRVTEEGSPEHDRPIWVNRWIRFSGGDNCPNDGVTNNLTGCNFSVLREVNEKTGGFDERYVGVAVREESDYAQRVLAAGYRIGYSARAAVFHHRSNRGGHGAGGDPVFFSPAYYFSELLFARKHFSPLAVAMYRVRLKLRGWRAIRHLVRHAEKEVDKALVNTK